MRVMHNFLHIFDLVLDRFLICGSIQLNRNLIELLIEAFFNFLLIILRLTQIRIIEIHFLLAFVSRN